MMEMKTIGRSNVIANDPAAHRTDKPGQDLKSGGPSFGDTLDSIQSKTDLNAQALSNVTKAGEINPAVAAKANAAASLAADPVKFSNHAVERMRSRGISFQGDDLKKLSDAVDKAAAKGSKDSLILMNDSALIVSVKNKTVVTVMDKSALKENVFTNIDSTIVM